MGRWLSRDPLGEEGGLNLYVFVQNNPLNYFDPYGLFQNPNINPQDVKVVLEGGQVVVIAISAGKYIAYIAVFAKTVAVAGTGALSYYITSKLIEDTWLESGLGYAAYDLLHKSSDSNPPDDLCPCADLAIAIKEIVADKEEIHHIATDKNYKSTARGGPWSSKFETIFKKGGINLGDEINKVIVAGHKGPHPEEYHRIVYERLVQALRGAKSKDDCNSILKKELETLAREIKTPGTGMNKLVTE